MGFLMRELCPVCEKNPIGMINFGRHDHQTCGQFCAHLKATSATIELAREKYQEHKVVEEAPQKFFYGR